MKRIITAIVTLIAVVSATVFLASQSTAANNDDPVCTEKVIDVPAHDEVLTPEHWQRYSWTGGPHESDDPPAFPSDDWQPNVQGDPHQVGVAGPYYRSNGNSGNGDWFYLELVPAVIMHVDDTYKDVEVPCPPTDTPPTSEPPVVTPPNDEPKKPVTPTVTTHTGLPDTGA